MKKFALLLMLFLSFGASADNNNIELIDTAKYEIKSDLINFDYSKIGYPISNVSIGGDFSLNNRITPPRKLVPSENNKSYRDIQIDSLLGGFIMVLCMFISCILIVLLLFLLDFILEKMKKTT